MKILISLFTLFSFTAIGSTPNVEKIYADHDKNKNMILEKKEHKKIFREYRNFISKCIGLPKEQDKLEFVAYLNTVRWGELPRVVDGLSRFSFYGTYFIQFKTTKKEMQKFIDLCN